MKKCLNCNNNLISKDKYCRYCGCKVRNSGYYIFLKTTMILLTIFIIIILILIGISIITR